MVEVALFSFLNSSPKSYIAGETTAALTISLLQVRFSPLVERPGMQRSDKADTLFRFQQAR